MVVVVVGEEEREEEAEKGERRLSVATVQLQ